MIDDGMPVGDPKDRQITALRAENERLRAAHKAIMDLQGEINESNYNHDDVVKINNAFCEAFHISSTALEEKP